MTIEVNAVHERIKALKLKIEGLVAEANAINVEMSKAQQAQANLIVQISQAEGAIADYQVLLGDPSTETPEPVDAPPSKVTKRK